MKYFWSIWIWASGTAFAVGLVLILGAGLKSIWILASLLIGFISMTIFVVVKTLEQKKFNTWFLTLSSAVKGKKTKVELLPGEAGQRFYELTEPYIELVGHEQIGIRSGIVGIIAGHSVLIGCGNVLRGITQNFISLVVSFDQTFSGQAVLLPSDFTVRYHGQQTDLESVEFNTKTIVMAKPRPVAFEVFSPDLMDWYLRQVVHPWVYVNENRLCLIWEFTKPPSVDLVLAQATSIFSFIDHSGALMKKAEPLFP